MRKIVDGIRNCKTVRGKRRKQKDGDHACLDLDS
jgi:hypothetical protein